MSERRTISSDLRAATAALNAATRFGPTSFHLDDPLRSTTYGVWPKGSRSADEPSLWQYDETELVVDTLVASAAGRALLRRKLAAHSGTTDQPTGADNE